jgi:hypothetical protein
VTPNNLQAWFSASKQLGCGDASVGTEKSIACMRNQTTQSLLGAIAVANPLQAVLGNFGPSADNKVVFSDYKAAVFYRKQQLRGGPVPSLRFHLRTQHH